MRLVRRRDRTGQSAYQRLVDAELDRRYYAADWKGVAQACDLSPPKCEDAVVVYEKMLIDSHNDAASMSSG